MSTGRSVLIVDDEQPARERMQRLVAELPGWAVAGTCSNGSDALALTAKLDPAVVFTTAYDEYALQAFEAQAVGYLLKPVRRERLEEALKHASRLSSPQLHSLATQEHPLARREHVAVRVRDQLKLIPVKDIRYFRADRKYVTVRHARGEDLLDESLRALEEEFRHEFVRAHRSLLVGVAHVEALERSGEEGYTLRLRGEPEPLPVSRRHVADLRKRLEGRWA